MKLGAYYWDGWFERIPAQTDRLLMEFPDRMPVWGWIGDTVENMELQIDMAADAGLAYFAFDWYYSKSGKHIKMNECVDRYLASYNRDRINWCLLVANHDDYRIYRDDWDKFCDAVTPYLADDRALQAGGRPMIIIFSPDGMIDDLGGEAEAKKCFEQFRKMTNNAYIVAGCPGVPRDDQTNAVSRDSAEWTRFCNKLENGGFDAISGYNYHRFYLTKGDTTNLIYPFEQLSADHELIWEMFAKHSHLPYIPCVNGGWDCRPWEPSKRYKGDAAKPSCYSPDRTPYTQYEHVKNARIWLRDNPNNSVDGLAIVYAWNENGEGGYIQPTIGDNGSILQSVSRAVKEKL